MVLTLSCMSVFGADTGTKIADVVLGDIRIVTTASTNVRSGSVTIKVKDVFTRDGKTNLVRRTTTKDSSVQIRIQQLFHDGLKVADLIAMQDSSSTTTQGGTPWTVGFSYGSSNELRFAAISTKDGVILDAFTCTNGMLFPATKSIIQKANDVGVDVKDLLSPEHVKKTTPQDFRRDVEDLIEKHKGK